MEETMNDMNVVEEREDDMSCSCPEVVETVELSKEPNKRLVEAISTAVILVGGIALTMKLKKKFGKKKAKNTVEVCTYEEDGDDDDFFEVVDDQNVEPVDEPKKKK